MHGTEESAGRRVGYSYPTLLGASLDGWLFRGPCLITHVQLHAATLDQRVRVRNGYSANVDDAHIDAYAVDVETVHVDLARPVYFDTGIYIDGLTAGDNVQVAYIPLKE
jgi:hypothetical protein